MHAIQVLAVDIPHSEVAITEVLQADQSFTAACTQARDLVGDFFSRGSTTEENQEPFDDASLNELYHRMEASIRSVAQLRSSSYAEVRQKRTLSEILRPYRCVSLDWLAAIEESVDDDMRHLQAKPTRVALSGQGGFFGWALPWKQRSEDPPAEPARMRA